MQVVDGTQLHIEQIPDLSMAVGIVSNTVELQVRVSQAGFRRLSCELLALCELDSVCCRLHTGVTEFAGIRDGIQEVRGHRRFATGELDGHLTPGFYPDGVVHDFHDLFPGQLVNVAYLVCIHETGIAHHVATVREINRENGTTAMPDSAAAVIV